MRLFLTLFFAITCIALAYAISAQGAFLRCGKEPLLFDFEKNDDIKCLCQSTTKALSVLQSMGLETSHCITVKVTDDFLSEAPHSLLGTYDPRTQEIKVLSYSSTKELPPERELTSGLEMTEDLWCSFVAHELAHAVLNHNQAKMNLSRIEKECAAYVTQLQVLHSETLRKFLETYGDVEAYNSNKEMTDTYLLLDPNRFAVKCYLHYLSLDNPKRFILELSK